jgi:hypothetical protein
MTNLIPVPKPVFDPKEFEEAPDKKTFIGNTIYPYIHSILGENYAGRVTGMILDENVVNIH